MIKSPLDLLKVEMKIFLRNSAILVEPVFSKRPEPINAIEVISAFWLTLLFSYHYVITTDG